MVVNFKISQSVLKMTLNMCGRHSNTDGSHFSLLLITLIKYIHRLCVHLDVNVER